MNTIKILVSIHIIMKTTFLYVKFSLYYKYKKIGIVLYKIWNKIQKYIKGIEIYYRNGLQY